MSCHQQSSVTIIVEDGTPMPMRILHFHLGRLSRLDRRTDNLHILVGNDQLLEFSQHADCGITQPPSSGCDTWPDRCNQCKVNPKVSRIVLVGSRHDLDVANSLVDLINGQDVQPTGYTLPWHPRHAA